MMKNLLWWRRPNIRSFYRRVPLQIVPFKSRSLYRWLRSTKKWNRCRVNGEPPGQAWKSKRKFKLPLTLTLKKCSKWLIAIPKIHLRDQTLWVRVMINGFTHKMKETCNNSHTRIIRQLLVERLAFLHFHKYKQLPLEAILIAWKVMARSRYHHRLNESN